MPYIPGRMRDATMPWDPREKTPYTPRHMRDDTTRV
jgi:hypothetical protein